MINVKMTSFETVLEKFTYVDSIRFSISVILINRNLIE